MLTLNLAPATDRANYHRCYYIIRATTMLATSPPTMLAMPAPLSVDAGAAVGSVVEGPVGLPAGSSVVEVDPLGSGVAVSETQHALANSWTVDAHNKSLAKAENAAASWQVKAKSPTEIVSVESETSPPSHKGQLLGASSPGQPQSAPMATLDVKVAQISSEMGNKANWAHEV